MNDDQATNVYPDHPVPMGSYVTANYPPPPARTGGKAVRVLAALAVVFFLATGAFAALWLVERGDHRDTTGQLHTARAEADSSKARQQAAEADAKEADNKVKQAVDQQHQAEAAGQRDKACADAARAVLKAAIANDEKAGEQAGQTLALSCG